ncbi:SDR family oxidoreductase [Leucobacter luti]|uniref:Short-subunit dehydrogenase n=1 Tax=Leucobacter luti TaxID=340320 RepID=A0A4Q7TYJ3_9MICO|nr:SDR family NAD(P)-dependent oxidoreductase [Leucobacter luti]MBL3698837.1 SDR family NAD(P)-dependent oxidoreductase [Leucobacter luti]RZT66215.1 short-subunit dehydrogenase [Leucobacter luti]
MRIVIVGASLGLGRALLDGLRADGHEVTGVSRRAPVDSDAAWIEADFSRPNEAAARLARDCPPEIDVLIWNLGVWEPDAFSDSYDYLAQSAATTEALVALNVTGPLLTIQTLLPRILRADHRKIILTGSTSALARSGRPEVAFGATKSALNGLADALREGFRAHRLAVTTLQLGNLNTEDGLDVPRARAAARGAGTLIPVHDVVDTVRHTLALSGSAYIREIVMPAILDERF